MLTVDRWPPLPDRLCPSRSSADEGAILQHTCSGAFVQVLALDLELIQPAIRGMWRSAVTEPHVRRHMQCGCDWSRWTMSPARNVEGTLYSHDLRVLPNRTQVGHACVTMGAKAVACLSQNKVSPLCRGHRSVTTRVKIVRCGVHTPLHSTWMHGTLSVHVGSPCKPNEFREEAKCRSLSWRHQPRAPCSAADLLDWMRDGRRWLISAASV